MSAEMETRQKTDHNCTFNFRQSKEHFEMLIEDLKEQNKSELGKLNQII